MSRLYGHAIRATARLPLPVLHAIGTLIGWLFYMLPNHHRATAYRNLQLCYRDTTLVERRRLLRRHLVETGKTAMETPLVWFASAARQRRICREVVNGELLDQAMATGNGVIIVIPHFGSWEYVAYHLAQRYPTTCMHRPPRQPSLGDTIEQGRLRTGTQLVTSDSGGVRQLLKRVRSGEVIGIAPDQDPRERGGLFAPFFGIAANTMGLLTKLAQRSNAEVIYCCSERLRWGRGFRVHFIAAPTECNDGDQQVAITALNRGIEQCVAIAPAQYQWSYKRFRTRPDREPPLY